MHEAQELFGIEFDAQPPPVLDFASGSDDRVAVINLDGPEGELPPPDRRAQAFTLWLRTARLNQHDRQAAGLIRQVLDENPFTTLQVVWEPIGHDARSLPAGCPPRDLEALVAACQEKPTYLDRYYALQPGRPNGAKRLVLLLPMYWRTRLDPDWLAEVGRCATLVWRGASGEESPDAEWEGHEYEWIGPASGAASARR